MYDFLLFLMLDLDFTTEFLENVVASFSLLSLVSSHLVMTARKGNSVLKKIHLGV